MKVYHTPSTRIMPSRSLQILAVGNANDRTNIPSQVANGSENYISPEELGDLV